MLKDGFVKNFLNFQLLKKFKKMVKFIDCECGEKIKVDYTAPIIISTGFINNVIKKVYSFRCDKCGNEYIEEPKNTIWLK